MAFSCTPQPCRRLRPRLPSPPPVRASAVDHSIPEGMKFRLLSVRPSVVPYARSGRVSPSSPLPPQPLSAASGLQSECLVGFLPVCSARGRGVRGTPHNPRSAPPGTPLRQSLRHPARPARVSAFFWNTGELRLMPDGVRVSAGAARAGALEDVSARVDGEVLFAGIVGGHPLIHNGDFRRIVKLQAINVLQTQLVHPASPKFQKNRHGRTE